MMTNGRRGRGFWPAMVAVWEASGLDVATFCEREGLVVQQLQSARWRVKQQRGLADVDSPAFVPMTVTATVLATAPVLEVVLRGGRCVRVPAGFDREALAEVVVTLEALPC